MENIAVKQGKPGEDTPEIQIISMLYDGAIKFIAKAEEKMEIGDAAGRSYFIRRAVAIIHELLVSINTDGGALSLNLKNLYEFVLESLGNADTANDRDALHNAKEVLDILRSGWSEMQEAKSVGVRHGAE